MNSVGISEIILIIAAIAFLCFSILYVFRSFKAFAKVIDIDKKFDVVIQLLKDKK